MKKQITGRRLRLSKDTLRNLVPTELQQVGGGISCNGASACDCSGTHTTGNTSTLDTTVGTSGMDTVDMCSTRIPV